MKLCVYAICKNELKNLDKWIDSIVDEADYIAILDTGSTDGTFERLCNYADDSLFLDSWGSKATIFVERFDYEKELGIMRFDKARNDSLKLIPKDTDICVRLDLDEFPDKGWSKIIKQRFEEGYTEVWGDIYTYDETGKQIKHWRTRNVHPNNPHWIWTRVIHETINYFGDNKESEVKQIYDSRFAIRHYPDNSKDRSIYKELLKYSCKEYPKDPYYRILLGVDLDQRGEKEEAYEAFLRCINECDFSENPNYLHQVYLNLATLSENPDEAIQNINQAFETGIKTRRSYILLAEIYEKLGNIDKAIGALEDALKEVPTYSSDWITDKHFFEGYIEDKLSLLYYFQKQNPLKAIEFCVKALQLDPTNKRIQNNLKFYYEFYQINKEN